MEKQKRIAVIQDISGAGKCSLTVALPVTSAAGVECCVLPTAVLSTHTAFREKPVICDLTESLVPMAEHWKREGLGFDGVFCGYISSPRQGEKISRVFDILSDENTLKIVDPAMGDGGRLYSGVDGETAEAFKTLCRKADIILPNLTEAALLCGEQYKAGADREYIRFLGEKLGELCGGTVIFTGVENYKGGIGNIIYRAKSGEMTEVFMPRLPENRHGTGDLFASAFSALMLRGKTPESAARLASRLVYDAIRLSIEKGVPPHLGLEFEPCLEKFIESIKNTAE